MTGNAMLITELQLSAFSPVLLALIELKKKKIFKKIFHGKTNN